MKRKLAITFSLLLVAVSIFSFNIFSEGAIKVSVDGKIINFDVEPIMKDGRVFIPIRGLFSEIGANIKWDNDKQIVIITGLENTIKIQVGQKEAYINDKQVTLENPAFIYKGRTLVPLRFITEAQDIKVVWDKDNKTVEIVTDYLKQSIDNTEYILNRRNGALYYIVNNGEPKLIKNVEVRSLLEEFKVIKTHQGNILVTIIEAFGEPQISYSVQNIYLQNNQVKQYMTANYFKRFEHNLEFYDNFVILTDGKKIYLLDDKTGEINNEYNLIELYGKEGRYFIEGLGANFIIIRSDHEGLLTLINIQTKEKVILYKQIRDDSGNPMNVNEIEYIEKNDIPYWGDYLHFIEMEGNTLIFENKRQIPINDMIKVCPVAEDCGNKADSNLYYYQLAE